MLASRPCGEPRVAAAAAASRRSDRRRWWIAFGGVAVLLIAIVLGAFVSNRGGSSKTAAAGSASGQQCVAMTDTPPEGAPYVPVHVGPAPTQLVTEELRAGTGTDPVQPGDSVTVNYVGVNCRDGKIFDSSWNQGHPVSFQLGDVIPGWQQGIPGMRVGEQRLLGIPPNLAYGAAGRPGHRTERNAVVRRRTDEHRRPFVDNGTRRVGPGSADIRAPARVELGHRRHDVGTSRLRGRTRPLPGLVRRQVGPTARDGRRGGRRGASAVRRTRTCSPPPRCH